MAGKLWRSRGRFVLSNLLLFGLGVMTCLICLQMFATSGINDPIVYTNAEEYRLAMQLNQPPAAAASALQQQTETDQRNNNNGINNSPNLNTGAGAATKSKSAVLCVSQPVAGVTTAKKSIPSTNSNPANSNTDDISARSSGNPNSNNEIGQSSSSSRDGSSGGDLARSQTDNLNRFEGIALPTDNNNNNANNDNNEMLLNGRDLLLQDDNADGASSGQTVYVVTPTFYRPEQKPELTRVAQALLPVSDFVHWVVIEDTSKGTDASFEELRAFLKRFPLAVTLLKSLPPKTRIVGKPRGVGGRTAAIQWLRENAQEGVVYFADDDNTYDSSIFKQMQTTEKVTMWPVGLVTDLGVSSPIVKNGRVVGFYDGWNGQRKFPVDMAGFAINLQLFLDNPKASMPWKAGYEEDELLQSLGITMKDIKPLANNCTEILVWHTKAVKNVWPKKPKNLSPTVAANTNLHILLRQLPQKTSSVTPTEPHNKSDNGFSFLRIFFGNGL